MAHFAQLNEDNVVIQVIVVGNNDIKDAQGNESEEVGINFCRSLLGAGTNWKQTSYNSSFRRRYAGIGYVYNADLDAFIPPKPYPSWTLDNDTANWIPPVPMPADGDPSTLPEGATPKLYVWNEDILNWEEFVQPIEPPPSE
jgi:hypothetical protein